MLVNALPVSSLEGPLRKHNLYRCLQCRRDALRVSGMALSSILSPLLYAQADILKTGSRCEEHLKFLEGHLSCLIGPTELTAPLQVCCLIPVDCFWGCHQRATTSCAGMIVHLVPCLPIAWPWCKLGALSMASCAWHDWMSCNAVGMGVLVAACL